MWETVASAAVTSTRQDRTGQDRRRDSTYAHGRHLEDWIREVKVKLRRYGRNRSKAPSVEQRLKSSMVLLAVVEVETWGT